MSVPFSYGQFYFGGGMTFNSNSDYKALGLTGKVGMGVSDKFDVNTNITYYLASRASWAFDFDLHYNLVNLNENFILNPFAGINFTRTDITNNSLNLGIAIKVPTDQYTYYAEPRWILDNSQFALGIGVIF
jgi:outer membrane autotransporter protein